MPEEHELNENNGSELFPIPQRENGSGLLSISNTSKWDEIHQIFYQGQNWYRVVDVIDALEVAKDPADYWGKMKRRISSEGFSETRQEMMQFELKSPKDKRLRKHDYATRQSHKRFLPR